MDISTGMVAQYNKVAREANYTEDKMHAVAGNLLADDAPAEYGDFDLVVISLALHHVADPVEMIRKLSERLAEGGVLIVVDFFSGPEGEPEQPMAIATDNPVRHTVIKSGFREMELKESFEKAGLGAWGWRLFREGSMIPEEFGGDRQLFLAKGSKQTKA